MGYSMPKFKCPECGAYISGKIYKGEPEVDGYKRYRKCEKCGVGIITLETITHTSKKKRPDYNRIAT